MVNISGDSAFSILIQPANNAIAPGASETFVVRFAPLLAGTVQATISIANNDSNENPYTFRVQGTGVAPLTEGPGGVTNHLALWLKGTDGLGYTSGQPVSLWEDQGRGANATVNTPGQEPTYFDDPYKNINFNPVVDFDNNYSSVPLDGDFSFDNTNTQFLEGNSGYFSQDVFVVLIPDVTVNNTFGSMDVFCGDEDINSDETDATGIGLGAYSVRFSNEVLAYCHGTTNSGNGYGVAEISTTSTYDNAGIINARNNLAASQQELYYNALDKENTQNDVADFANVNDSRYWIGRSEGWEASTDARIAEIITFSSRKNDTDLTQERNRIQSYLAIKYGITLGVNGTSQDYVDSDGNTIWDANTGTPAEDVFNFDIAGIGRDDASDLLQKQSRSVNNTTDGLGRTQGVLTIGMGSIANTNNLNTNNELQDKEFLVWGNNGVDLNTAAPDVTVNMSADITPALTTDVTFSAISRVWKVVENVSTGGDIPTVEVAILKSAVRTATPPDGRYLMFISDTPNFDPTADYRVMTEATNELGEAILKTNYDFDNTKYITFGWAPERRFERSVYFNGVDSYMDMEDALNLNQAAFTISAWVMREANATNKSILSKRDAAYTEGYDFKINASGKLEVSWRTPLGVAQIITSNTTIPQSTWHHLAIIYNGTTATLYIDGVQDTQANLLQPGNTNQSFFIGAAAKLAPEAFFHGNIDEVRIWNTAISVDQLRYIMNQEIKENAGTIGASYFMDEAITPTKNEIASIPWSSLDAYYPMSTYTYTNTKDESGNGHQGALRTLRTVDRQTAPLPYKTVATGTSDWDLNTTWLYGPYQTIPGAASIVDNTITVDWNIVETDDNINMNNSSLPATANENRTLLALVNKSSEITVEGDNSTNTGFGLTITHYLQLDGKIDLEGESQLIQTSDSDLVVGTNGALEKDQQGTRDLYTYNYWSAPVGYTATTNPNNYRYTLNDNIMKDGTNPLAPVNINYIGGYDGSNGSPIGIAHYWIWKFNNYLSDDYASWQHVRNTGTLLAGEGFTMKGVNNTNGAVHLEQNYVFEGKPNNGNISLPINAGNEYLVGNPYASALDAQQFITDNGPTISGAGTDPTISGTLYFWEHWGGGSHILREYQGGYATYNYSGGTPAAAMGTSDPDVATGGTPTKIPGDYIPVGQGFFVEGETNGNIIFNNTQRIFQKEGGTASVFVRNNEEASPTANADLGDERTKVRLGFNSVNTIRRQLLVTVDERATANYDWGFDAKNLDTQIDDMSWLIAGELYIIQGINEINQTTILPISIKTRDEGLNSITIDALVNFPDHLQIYVHDKDLGMYHNLRSSDYQINLPAGEYSERFEITFSEESLSIEELEANDLDASYVNESESIVIKNPNNLEIEKVEILNILGQTIYTFKEDSTSNFLEYKTNKLSTGTYILKLKTKNTTWSKKVLIN